MTKTEFLKRWAKKATDGGAVEAFENDVEKLTRTLVRLSASAVTNGLIAGLGDVSRRDREKFRKLIKQISPAVEGALAKLYQ